MLVAVGLPATVKEIMDTWTLQMGFPLINVTSDYNTSGAVVSQERFLLRKDPSSTDTHVYRWWVPLTYTSGGSLVRQTQWLSKDQATKTINNQATT
ncbi:Aminopeptidase N [Daphnia magna]|uniref:Aminopeptidase N n=1 Tax=Daphnia magna TaxID=35525 RepID=A0A164ZJN2_9CRUS|nr:Aminopeptidase N [Daphnia magna]